MNGVKHGGRAMSVPAGLTYGVGVSLGITIVLSAIVAKLVVMEILSETRIGYAVLCILFLAAYTGASISAKKIKSRRLMVCVLSGALYWIVLLSATALLFGGSYEAVGVTGLLIFGGSVAAVLLRNEKKRGGKRKKIH